MTALLRNFMGIARTIVRTPLNLLLNLADPPVIVLVYHRVTSLSCDPEMLAVTPENFRAQMHYLKDNVPLVRFEEDWTKAPRPAVAVTFDDGYADNALEALPILEEVRVPATFFVSTGTIGTTRKFWWYELERIIMESQSLPSSFTLNDGRFGKSWPTGTSSERQQFYQQIVPLMKNIGPERREGWLAQLHLWAGGGDEIGDPTHRTMTVEELLLLAESDWATVGAHTVTHSRLSSLTVTAQLEEISASKRQLEAWLGREITVFSYPYGRRSDYTSETVELCRKAGFSKAAANFPGQAHGWTDPYRIPRLLVRDWPVETFAKRLREFWTR
jgi:peptidoglycan/xylan/chitin deacetylase (PgdA/CDA1 family)